MTRAIAMVAFLLCACANGHHTSTGGDSAIVDSSEVPIDTPQGTIDTPTGTIDSPPGTIDSPVGTIDGSPIDGSPIDGPVTTIDGKPPDAMVDANNCPVQPCTLAPQCGCPAAQTCDIDPSTLMGNICRAINVPGTETSTCNSFSECAKGYVCLGDSACHKYCANNTDCTGPRGQCVIQVVDGSNNPISGAVICSSNCDPLGTASTYCPANDKCGIFSATYMGVAHDITDCEAQGAGGQGSDCTVAGSNPPNGDDTKCAANQMCTTLNGTTFQCRHVCNRANSSGCTAQQTCLGFNPALAIGGTTYGVCN